MVDRLSPFEGALETRKSLTITCDLDEDHIMDKEGTRPALLTRAQMMVPATKAIIKQNRCSGKYFNSVDMTMFLLPSFWPIVMKAIPGDSTIGTNT